jgi:alpha-1,3-rhamnosyl/mannosyltransferase
LFHALNFAAATNIAPQITIPLIYDISFERFPEVHPRERVEWLRSQLTQVNRHPYINTISEFSANEISEYYNYPRERIVVTYPGINPLYENVYNNSDQEFAALRLQRDSFFLMVGTLEPRKNHRILFEAYLSLPPLVRKNYPLVLVGASGWGDVINKEARRLFDEGSLRLLGYTGEQDLRALYRNARALLFPSVYEGFGMPAVEAMASGLPLILSDIPVLREVCGAHAQFVPPTESDAWAAALEASISGPGRDEGSEEAMEFAKRYSWERTATRTLEMYSAVTDGERSSAG